MEAWEAKPFVFFMSAMAFVIVSAENFAALAYSATLSIMFLIMGYSSYTMVPIRANAQVPNQHE